MTPTGRRTRAAASASSSWLMLRGHEYREMSRIADGPTVDRRPGEILARIRATTAGRSSVRCRSGGTVTACWKCASRFTEGQVGIDAGVGQGGRDVHIAVTIGQHQQK